MQRNAAAKTGFQINVTDRLDFNPKVEAVVTGQGRAAGLHARVEIAFAIGGFSIRGAGRGGGTAEDSTDNGLRAPWRHVVRGSRKAQGPGVNLRTCLGLKVVSEGDKGTMKILSVINRISYSQIDKWRESVPAVL